jgi:hypothetical protein
MQQQPLTSVEKKRILRAKKKRTIIELFGGKCTNCGYDKCPAALQFHHLDPKQKEKGITHMIARQGLSLEKIIKEAEKCILLCANCHAELHFNESENVRYTSSN